MSMWNTAVSVGKFFRDISQTVAFHIIGYYHFHTMDYRHIWGRLKKDDCGNAWLYFWTVEKQWTKITQGIFLEDQYFTEYDIKKSPWCLHLSEQTPLRAPWVSHGLDFTKGEKIAPSLRVIVTNHLYDLDKPPYEPHQCPVALTYAGWEVSPHLSTWLEQTPLRAPSEPHGRDPKQGEESPFIFPFDVDISPYEHHWSPYVLDLMQGEKLHSSFNVTSANLLTSPIEAPRPWP